MRRISFWALSTLTSVVLLFGYHTSTSGAAATAGPTTTTSGTGSYAAHSTAGSSTTPAAGAAPGGETSSTPSTAPSSTPSSTPSASASPAAKTVAGDTVQTRWGPVQVQIAVSGSSITDVSVLQYPSDNPRDQEINAYALPQLTQETVDAQSADIAMVSGATYTSDGYVRSLQSALDRAGL